MNCVGGLIRFLLEQYRISDMLSFWFGNVLGIPFNYAKDEYLTRWGPGLLRLGAVMSFGGYCVSRPGLLRLGTVVG